VKSPAGALDTVQPVAVELNPDPVNEATELATPFVGVMVIVGTTVKATPGTESPPGLPVTITVHILSAVVVGPTMNVPVPVPALIVHEEEAIRAAPLTPLFDVMLHDVSVVSKPLATKEMVWPGEPYDGVRVSKVATVTWNVPTPVSPKLPVTITV
jgi:hypothetical protein